MAFYKQSGNCPKFGTAQGLGASSGAGWGRNVPQGYPISRAVYGPQKLQPNMETQTRWTPYGTFTPRPYYGGWDGLDGRLMHVPQADMYDVSRNPWPANGVDDQPNARFDILRLQPTTSAHPGLSIPSVQGGPSMVFQPPPVWGLQTVPIPALGL